MTSSRLGLVPQEVETKTAGVKSCAGPGRYRERELHRWGTDRWREAAGYQLFAYERMGEVGCDRTGRSPTLWG